MRGRMATTKDLTTTVGTDWTCNSANTVVDEDSFFFLTLHPQHQTTARDNAVLRVGYNGWCTAGTFAMPMTAVACGQ